MKNKHAIGIFLMLSLLFAGCIKEDTEDCFSGLRLDFYFTLHTGKSNLFGEKVQQVHVYLFDENKVLRLYAVDNGNRLEYTYLQKDQMKTVTSPNAWGALPDNYVMNLDKVPAGKYRIISWAESNAGSRTSFFHGHMNNPATHDFSEGVTLGVTTMDDLYLFLQSVPAPSLPEDIVPEVDEIDDLWYGAVGTRHPEKSTYAVEEVVVKNGSVAERHIELIRNTNILKVTVSGMENIISATGSTPDNTPRQSEDNQLRLWTVASNERYKCDNTIGEFARSIRYTPFHIDTDGQTLHADIKVLRLDMERPVLLYIETPDGRRIPSQPIDIVDKLRQARDPDTGEYVYNSQSDFDRIYEHPIEVRIGADMEIRIFIGEWEIVNVKPAE